MTARRLCSTLVAVAFLLVPIACGPAETPCPPSKIGSWSADPEPEVYVGDDLFIYINGGAEIYHEYGFQQVSVRRYENGEDRVSVEIYTMDESAYGVYSYSRSQDGQRIELGDGATLADYYLHTWAGKEMAVVTAETELDNSREAILEIARNVAGCLATGGAVPTLVAETASDPEEDGVPVYVRGQLALVNVARPAAALFSGFQEGVVRSTRKHDGASARKVHLAWESASLADKALATARQKAEEDEGVRVHDSEGPRLDVSLGGYRMSASRSGRMIEIRVTEEAP